MQVHAQRPGRSVQPPFLVDGERARAGGQAGSRGQRVTVNLDAGKPGPRRRVALDRLPARRVRRRQQVLALGDEPPGALAPAPPLPELADLLQLLVVVGGDGHRLVSLQACM